MIIIKNKICIQLYFIDESQLYPVNKKMPVVVSIPTTGIYI
jgi:hypothetical protein